MNGIRSLQGACGPITSNPGILSASLVLNGVPCLQFRALFWYGGPRRDLHDRNSAIQPSARITVLAVCPNDRHARLRPVPEM
jgi:hypothetical protein